MKKYLLALSLALAAASAQASVYVESLNTGVSSATIGLAQFAPFDVQLGQLEEESILLSGTGSVSLGSGPADIVVLLTPNFGSQAAFGFHGNPQAIPISIDWSFPAMNSWPVVDSFRIEGISPDFNRVVNDTPLSGEVEYFYTPNASTVPEASTWMMLLSGFALIGAMGWRRSRREPA
jgi:hypothetical protein